MLNSLEDSIFKAMRKKKEEKPFDNIHHGSMNKLYNHHPSQNPPLLVNPLANGTPQASLDPSPRHSHRKIKKTSNPLINSNTDTRKRK